ncbi:hypothetical protein RUM43_011717 [Polyplax serrata]|uniref:U3 small nucleolar RNA-associated protein 15 homolog n=1 Tax=Polyplax serrata TaxID=468196 RepID=A0AAN8P908_POLSC
MGEFKKLNYNIFGKNVSKSTPDIIYWKKLGVPAFLKEFGPVDYIDFSPIEPHYFAVTSSVRVQVYNPITRLLHKNLSRFEKSAYGGTFRRDGKLLCAGGEENLVKLFDVSTKSLLRVFEGHGGPVHRCFFTINNTHIVSFSDDNSVKFWDIPGEKEIVSFSEHSDYIRAGAVSPVSPDVVVSGGYDGCVKMYDKRNKSVVSNLNHGSPVESVIFLPTGGVLVTAGGTEIKVWDVLCANRLLARFHHHHKTVTCMCLASKGSRLLSGSLDRHVNVYDMSTFQKVHSLDYPNSVLSVGISTNDETIAVGMVDGLVSVSRRETDFAPSNYVKREKKFRYAAESKIESADLLVGDSKKERFTRYDVHLKRFEFTKALNVVLAPYVMNKTPEITVAVLQELLYRKTLRAAIAGFEDKTVVPLLRFVTKNLGDQRFTRVLIEVANVFLEIYEDSVSQCSPTVTSLLIKLDKRLAEEVDLTESLLCLKGCIRLMNFASNSESSKLNLQVPAMPLKPSESARDFVVNVG